MYRIALVFFVAAIQALAAGGCSKPAPEETELKHYPIDSLEGIISSSDVTFDARNSTDGNGSLQIDTWESMVVRLFEETDIDLEDARLIYRAKVMTEGVKGNVYLEMWCHFEGKGEYFSRDLGSPMTGTMAWSTEETVFLLEKGQNPDIVKLNLVIEGSGRVWIDDLRLIRGPA